MSRPRRPKPGDFVGRATFGLLAALLAPGDRRRFRISDAAWAAGRKRGFSVISFTRAFLVSMSD